MTRNKRLFSTADEDGRPREAGHDIAPDTAFKQELGTWEATEFGFTRKTITRIFSDAKHADNFHSEPVVLKQDG